MYLMMRRFMIVAVEQEFGIKFDMGQVTSMKNVGEMAQIILERAEN